MKIKVKSDNKEYIYVGLEKETAEKLKKAKPENKNLSQFIEHLLSLT